jgi:peptidoglycan L-alanyl-D-glutamate endopeptidase CwlK
MTIISLQSTFCADVARLIQYAQGLGWAVTFGEAWRPPEMQKFYFDNGKSKTMRNSHGDRLAVDLNFFKNVNGKFELTYNKKDLQLFGDFWEQLDTKNVWGGNWKSLVDTPHFERKV